MSERKRKQIEDPLDIYTSALNRLLNSVKESPLVGASDKSISDLQDRIHGLIEAQSQAVSSKEKRHQASDLTEDEVLDMFGLEWDPVEGLDWKIENIEATQDFEITHCFRAA